MHEHVFVSLPVVDVQKSMEFFRRLGYSFNPDMTNDSGAGLIINDSFTVMLVSLELFKSFIKKDVVDAHRATEMVILVSCESREAVDAMVKKAIDAGGKTFKQPDDYGFMYGHAFEDLDGHFWKPQWMDMAKFPKK